MQNKNHIARIINTGEPCVVVFREMYDDKGNITDENHCLVVRTRTLPDHIVETVDRVVNSESGQSNPNLYDSFAKERTVDGQVLLTFLAQAGRLEKMKTDNIEMIPNPSSTVRLDKLNIIIKMQKRGASQEQINAALAKHDSDNPSDAQTDNAVVIDDTEVAKMKLSEADDLEARAKALRDEAYALDSSLKPKRTRKAAPKKTTKA